MERKFRFGSYNEDFTLRTLASELKSYRFHDETRRRGALGSEGTAVLVNALASSTGSIPVVLSQYPSFISLSGLRIDTRQGISGKSYHS